MPLLLEIAMPVRGNNADQIIIDDPQAFPRWCPGCSREVREVCHHFNCAVGPHGLQAQIDAQKFLENIWEVVSASR